MSGKKARAQRKAIVAGHITPALQINITGVIQWSAGAGGACDNCKSAAQALIPVTFYDVPPIAGRKDLAGTEEGERIMDEHMAKVTERQSRGVFTKVNSKRLCWSCATHMFANWVDDDAAQHFPFAMRMASDHKPYSVMLTFSEPGMHGLTTKSAINGYDRVDLNQIYRFAVANPPDGKGFKRVTTLHVPD